jgi:integrase/recombinase XerD
MPLLPLATLAEVFPGILDLPGQLGTRSLVEYRRDVQHYLAWCAWDHARALDPQTLRAWRQHQVEHTGLSPYTINRRLAAVKRCVTASAAADAVDQGLAFRFGLVEPVTLVSLRQRLRAIRPLTPSDVRGLCRSPDPTTLLGLRDRAFLTLLAGSGVRLSEAISLCVGDVQAVQGAYVLRVLGKGQVRPRQAPCSAAAYGWVQRWLAVRARAGVEVAAIFTGVPGHAQRPTARPLSLVAAWARVKVHARRLGLPWLSPHDLRRFVGTQVAERYDVRRAQRVLGHRRIDTTALYYVLDELQPGLTDGLY